MLFVTSDQVWRWHKTGVRDAGPGTGGVVMFYMS